MVKCVFEPAVSTPFYARNVLPALQIVIEQLRIQLPKQGGQCSESQISKSRITHKCSRSCPLHPDRKSFRTAFSVPSRFLLVSHYTLVSKYCPYADLHARVFSFLFSMAYFDTFFPFLPIYIIRNKI